MANSSVLEGYSKEEEEITVQKKPLMEGHDQILCKKRRHSAIRDYPSGCGRFNVKLQQRSHSETCDDRKSSVLGSPIDEEEEEEEEEEEATFGEMKPSMGSEISCKRRKFFFATRDYPPGVGRFSAIKQDITVLDRGCSEEEEEEATFGEMKPSMGSEISCNRCKFFFAIRDYPPGVGRFSAIKQDITVLDRGCSEEEVEEEEAQAEEVEAEEEEEAMVRERKPLMKSKIAKYSAIRDYPAGCGRSAVS